MTDHFDEFSKSLADQSVPRRQSLRLLGAAVAAAVLGPLAPRTARAAGDPCKFFCNRYPRAQRSACIAACRACSGDTSRVCGSGGTFACCAAGTACCDGYCTDLASDFDHCGACGAACAYPGPYEDGACVDGHCAYLCVEGAADCGSGCTPLWSDPNNCGACGNVCGGSTPNCYQGACVGGCTPSCPEGWCGGDGCGGVCGCPSGMYCEYDGWCYPNPSCIFPFIPCDGVCVDPLSNRNHCGGCGVQCAPDEACISGSCVSG